MFAKRDLTQGSIPRGLLGFALPLVLGNLLQQLYNLADTWVVGRFIGEGALAAVGSFLHFDDLFDLHSPGAVHGQQRLFFHSIRAARTPTGCEMGFFSPFCSSAG